MSITSQTSNGITLDAWGRPKSITDKSLFSSKFTFDIPDFLWMPPVVVGDGVAASINGSLTLNSGSSSSNYAAILSRRHAAYQPNRGQLYSTAMVLPNAGAVGSTRRWGIYYDDANYQSGVLFELENGTLYGIILTTVDGVKKEQKVKLNVKTKTLEGGALFDIQFQWRGVGDYFFYVNQKLVGTIKNLEEDSNIDVTIINPSLPAKVEAINNGTQCELICGCIDVTSEGGGDPILRPITVDTNMTKVIEVTSTPMLILHIPYEFKGQHNSRDITILKAGIGLAEAGMVKILVTRDITAFGLATYGDINGDDDFNWEEPDHSCIKSYKNATLIDESKCYLVDAGFVAKAGDNISLSLDFCKVNVTHTEYIILYGKSDKVASTEGYGSLTLGEEI